MRVYAVAQGTEAWKQARHGIPTASQADRVITPKTLKPSSSQVTYRNQLLAERLVGHPIDWSGSDGYRDRGTGMEAEAKVFYELMYGVEVEQVGFIARDDDNFGGSPDGLVGTVGLLELKCPALHTAIGYSVSPDTLVQEYRGQCQALLYVTEREWIDLCAYNPELPAVVQRIERDEAYITALENALDVFCGDLDAQWERLQVLCAA